MLFYFNVFNKIVLKICRHYKKIKLTFSNHRLSYLLAVFSMPNGPDRLASEANRSGPFGF